MCWCWFQIHTHTHTYTRSHISNKEFTMFCILLQFGSFPNKGSSYLQIHKVKHRTLRFSGECPGYTAQISTFQHLLLLLTVFGCAGQFQNSIWMGCVILHLLLEFDFYLNFQHNQNAGIPNSQPEPSALQVPIKEMLISSAKFPAATFPEVAESLPYTAVCMDQRRPGGS